MKQKTKDSTFFATGARTARRMALASLAVCAAMLAGCSEENTLPDDGDGGQIPVNLVAGIQAVALSAASSADGTQAPHTRTAIDADGETIWKKGDAVGVIMFPDGSKKPSDVFPGGANVEYTVDPSKLSPAGGKPIYYPRDETVGIVAYYPYGAIGAGRVTDDYHYNVSVVNQSALESIDLLYASANNLVSSPDAVELPFRHALAKIQLNIILGESLSGLSAEKITAVTLTGMPVTGTFDLLGGGWSGLGNATNIAAQRKSTPTGYVAAAFTALFVPHTPKEINYAGRSIIVTVDGKDYTASIAAGDRFLSGYKYTYSVVVEKKANKALRLGRTTTTAR